MIKIKSKKNHNHTPIICNTHWPGPYVISLDQWFWGYIVHRPVIFQQSNNDPTTKWSVDKPARFNVFSEGWLQKQNTYWLVRKAVSGREGWLFAAKKKNKTTRQTGGFW
jgi:hypothetical protein